jgi:hypothetical protein
MSTRVQVNHRQPEVRAHRHLALEGWRQWADVASSRSANPATTRSVATVRDALLTGRQAARADHLVALMSTSDGAEWARALAHVGRSRPTRTRVATAQVARPTYQPAALSPGRIYVHGVWRP